MNDTRFRPGRSGNPAGRPKGARSARDAFRRKLARPDPADPAQSVLDAWADSVIAGAVTVEDRLMVLRWLEGPSPRTDPDDAGPTTLVDVARRMAAKFGGPGSPFDDEVSWADDDTCPNPT